MPTTISMVECTAFMARVVGIDLGSRRIGVAVSDELGLMAHPRTTIARKGRVRDLDDLGAVVKECAADQIVLGLPLDPEGGEGRAAKSARLFADRLRIALGMPVELIDESFTTVEAETALLEADLSRAKRKR